MSELELNKNQIVSQLQGLCAHCASGREHSCPLQAITREIQAINGIPLIVNNEFKGVLWT